MKIQVELDLTDDQVQALVRLAILNGWKRIDPRKSVKTQDYRDGVRYAIRYLVSHHGGL